MNLNHNNANLTFFYTDEYLNYISARNNMKNFSYCNTDDDYEFIAPILSSKANVSSGDLSYLPIPYASDNISTKKLKAEMKNYFNKIEKLGFNRIALRQDPLINYNPDVIKLLLNNKFVPNLFYTTVVDLTKSENELWSNIRRRYHSLINKMSKNDYTLVKVDAKNCETYFDEWENLYAELLKRGNALHKNDTSFVELKKSIKNNSSFLFLLYKNKKLYSGVNIVYKGTKAYYFLGGTNIEHEGEDSFSHYIFWKLIQDLKHNGFTQLEIGPVFYDNVHNFYMPSQKELSISDFKLGIGGDIKPFIIFEKKNLLKLTDFDESCIEKTFNWFQDEEFKQMYMTTRTVIWDNHYNYFINNLKDKTKKMFSILLDNNHIGNCGYFNIDNSKRTADLWIYIGEKDFWGIGIGTESLLSLLNYGKNELKLNLISLNVANYNTAAIKMYEKCGFKKIKAENDKLFYQFNTM